MLTHGIHIRAAVEDDAHRTAIFMSKLMAEAPNTITRRPAPSSDDQRQFIGRAVNAERGFILIAEDEEEIVGLLDLWAGVTPETCHAARFGMSVAKHRRNEGIGRRLVEAAQDLVLAWNGFCRLELEVAVWNMAAIHLYERVGFSVEGRKAKSINLRGRPEDTLLMARVW